MGKITGITWTHHTRNYWIGCTRVGPGCGMDHPEAGAGGGCYAERMQRRWGRDLWGDDKERWDTKDGASREVHKWNREAADTGERRRVFINSMSDVLDHRAPKGGRERIIQDGWECPWLDFLLLSKRIGNAERMLPSQLPPNVWIGRTVVDSAELRRDHDKHMRVNASVRFISFEPALGALKADDVELLALLNWIIWGGESGPKPRAIDFETLTALLGWRKAGRIPALFIKQFGEAWARERKWKHPHGADPSEWPEWARIQEFPSTS